MTARDCDRRGLLGAIARGSGIGGQPAASAQTYGLATMPPGTLAHTAASAIAKVLKEKGGLNTLVQPTAGESVLDPDGRARRDRSRHRQHAGGASTASRPASCRTTCASSARSTSLRIGFFSRKDSGMTTVADLKGKRVPAGYSAMRTLDKQLARDAGDRRPHARRHQAGHGAERAARRRRLHAGANDTFMFSFGGRRCARPTPRSAACARSRSSTRRRGSRRAARCSPTAISSRSSRSRSSSGSRSR